MNKNYLNNYLKMKSKSYSGSNPILVSDHVISLDENYTNELTQKIENNTSLFQQLNGLVETNVQSISKIKPMVEFNTTNINELITQFKNSVIINYKGEWTEGTTAKLGEVYSYQSALWICKVDTSSVAPSKGQWDKITSQDINLDNYYSKQEIDVKLQELELKFAKSIIFVKGVVYNLLTKANCEALGHEYGFTENDYEVLPLNEVVGTGENGEFIHNIVKNENIQKTFLLCNKSFNDNGNTAGGTNANFMGRGGGLGVTIGVDNPEPMVSSYRQYYFVKFKKTIREL